MSKYVANYTVGVLMFAALVFATSQSFAGEQKEMLEEAYKECDKLLIIPAAGEDLKGFYNSAGEVGECKTNRYREIYLEKSGNEIRS